MKKAFLFVALTTALAFGATSAFAASTAQDPSGGYNQNLYREDSGTTTYVPNANMSGYEVNALNDADWRAAGADTTDQTVIKNAYSDSAWTIKQRTHGQYARNTNSCASCHKTHTAEARNLLIKSDVYETCTACHDGTLGFYNVFDPKDAKNAAGTFGGDVDTDNASMHMVDESVTVSAAPGSYNLDAAKINTGEFSCAACHAPHGSFSDRLLAYDPGNQAVIDQVYGGMGIKGQALSQYNLAAAALTTYTVADPRYIIVKDTKDNYTAANAAGSFKNKLSFITGDARIAGSDTAITVFRRVYSNGFTYTPANTAWMMGAEYGQPTFVSFYTGTPGSNTDAISNRIYTDIKADYAKGIAWSTGATTGVNTTNAYGNIAQSVVVKLDLRPRTDIDNYTVFNVTYSRDASLADGTNIGSGNGVKMSQFCGACHVDYFTKSGGWGDQGSGMYSVAYRHTTDSDTYTCVRCHYAHGNSIWTLRDADGKTLADLGDTPDNRAYLKDVNPSSAIKKFTNMSVCWSCHTSSHSVGLTNNTDYATNYNSPLSGGKPKNYGDGTTKTYNSGLPSGL